MHPRAKARGFLAGGTMNPKLRYYCKGEAPEEAFGQAVEEATRLLSVRPIHPGAGAL